MNNKNQSEQTIERVQQSMRDRRPMSDLGGVSVEEADMPLSELSDTYNPNVVAE